jgi:flagellar hook-associated protein 2
MAVRMSGLVSNLDTEGIISSLMSVQKLKQTKIENKITKLEWKQEKWKALNTKLYSFYTDSLSKLRMQSSFSTKKVSSSDESVATVTASNSAPEGTHTLKVQQLASAQFVTGKQLTTDENSKAISTSTKLTDLNMTAGNTITVTAGTKTKTLEVTASTTVADFLSTLKNSGLNASYDTTQKRFFISSKESGYANAFSLSATTGSELSGLGLSTISKTDNGDGTTSVSIGSSGSMVAPKDAIYYYNGVKFTGSSNNISINGLSVTLKGTTSGLDTTNTEADDEVITLGVTNDTDAVYDMVKNFIKGYNELLKEMNTDYYAESASGYTPLTDDEKEAMSDTEVEKWETKIKDSLLRKDDSLGSLLNTMKTKMSASVKIDNKSYSLSSFGIQTSADYTEKGLLHIDGNSDDSLVASNTEKLKAALNNDPDTVMMVLTGIAGELYSSMSDSMSSNSMRSALTFYNDKDMKSTLTEYNDDLDDMQDRLQNMEDRYYAQFSKMETALSKLNSQSSSLSNMLGTSS